MFHISMGNNGAARDTFLLYLPNCTGKVVTDLEKANVLEEKPRSHPSDLGAVEAAKLKLLSLRKKQKIIVVLRRKIIVVLRRKIIVVLRRKIIVVLRGKIFVV